MTGKKGGGLMMGVFFLQAAFFILGEQSPIKLDGVSNNWPLKYRILLKLMKHRIILVALASLEQMQNLNIVSAITTLQAHLQW